MAGRGGGRRRAGRRLAVAVLAAAAIAAGVAAVAAPPAVGGDAASPPRPSLDALAANSALAGGAGYDRAVTRANATVVARDRAALLAALSNATPGDVVFVPGNATVNLTGDAPVWVPARVTLASDRGVDGSDGALLYTDRGRTGRPLLVAGGNATRITGLRLRGYGGGWTPAPRSRPSAWGVLVPSRASNVEIDNNYISRFVGVCVQASGNHTYVHHNHIEFCNRIGLGYGVDVDQQAVVACNYLDHTRHAVAAHGGPTNAYVARYNAVGRHTQNHVFDVHPPGGAWVHVHHNTVMAVSSYGKNSTDVASVRVGVPSGTARVHHNWFFQNASLAIWQHETHGPPYTEPRYTNLTVHDNAYGTEPPPPGVGALHALRADGGACG